MISLLIIAGISLTANAISWYNRKRLEEVQADIDHLNNKLASIYHEDIEKRKEITGEYITALISFAENERLFRDQLYLELNQALKSLKKNHKIGKGDSSSAIKLKSELIRMIRSLEAEIYFLKSKINILNSYLNEPFDVLPKVEDLITLPFDYPTDFNLVQIEESLPQQLHGYYLVYQDSDWKDQNQRLALIYDVDHENRTANASFLASFLFEAYEKEGSPIEAIVRDFTQSHVLLDYCGIGLLLDRKEFRIKTSYSIGDVLDVYPVNWDLINFSKSISKKANQINSDNRVQNILRVSLLPRVENSRRRWSSIPLHITTDKLSELVSAFNYLVDKGAIEEAFEIFYTESAELVFYVNDLSLCCKISTYDIEGEVLSKLEFIEARYGTTKPTLSIKMSTELVVTLEGEGEWTNNSPKLVNEFLAAFDKELEEKREFLNIRSTAFSLKKLDSIYKDQIEYKRLNSYCSFFPILLDIAKATIEGIFVEDIPSWLIDELNSENTNRIDAVSDDYVISIKKAELLNASTDRYKLYLDIPKSIDRKVIFNKPFNRIVYNFEGIPAQILSNTLKKAIAGKFKSPRIYNTLMNIDGTNIENVNRGREQVNTLLENEDNELVIVWGPPGTGKTTTIVNWILKLFEPGKESSWPTILITGPTHVSIDNILERILLNNGILSENMVRYGNEDKISDNLNLIWYNNLINHLFLKRELYEDDQQLYEKWQKLLSTKLGKRDVISWTIAKRKIHAATCVGMARESFNLVNRDYDIVVIDETGKAFQAEILLPAMLASKRLILIGDHMQLPPTVMQEDISQEVGYRLPIEEVEAIMKKNLFKSLFEQLPSDHKAMLDLQYRMHGDIGDVISAMFYDGKLKSSKRDDNERIFKKRINFIDFSELRSYQQTRFQQSLENQTEREALVELLRVLNKKLMFDNAKSILIICPYKGQRMKVQSLIKKLRLSLNIKVTTVDAVQGGEASIVILLMTRSRNSTDFLLDENRINVALSRAEDYVFIFGSKKCLTERGNSPFIRLFDPKINHGNLYVVKMQQSKEYTKVLKSLFNQNY